MCLQYMFKILKRKVVEDGCSLHFLEGTKININKLLRASCCKEIISWICLKVIKGLRKLKTIEN